MMSIREREVKDSVQVFGLDYWLAGSLRWGGSQEEKELWEKDIFILEVLNLEALVTFLKKCPEDSSCLALSLGNYVF